MKKIKKLALIKNFLKNLRIVAVEKTIAAMITKISTKMNKYINLTSFVFMFFCTGVSTCAEFISYGFFVLGSCRMSVILKT